MNLLITLYLVNFLRTVLIVFIIYLVIRIFSRYILPVLVEKKVKDIQERMKNQERQNQRSGRREGDVTIEYNNKNSGNHKQNNGEYVDFEEVD